jgi:hypothetical protein
MKIALPRDKILLIAIAASLVWHLFWLTGIKIISPKTRDVVRFSRVSFLGPVLARKSLEVRIAPGERSFLEKRFLDMMGDMATMAGRGQNSGAPGSIPEKDYFLTSDKELSGLVKNSLQGRKIEPKFNIE